MRILFGLIEVEKEIEELMKNQERRECGYFHVFLLHFANVKAIAKTVMRARYCVKGCAGTYPSFGNEMPPTGGMNECVP